MILAFPKTTIVILFEPWILNLQHGTVYVLPFIVFFSSLARIIRSQTEQGSCSFLKSTVKEIKAISATYTRVTNCAFCNSKTLFFFNP